VLLACARRLLAPGRASIPQFATHNALTVATVMEMAGGTDGYEFQRLHGMGEALYETLHESAAGGCRIYAPVGGHRDLLAYLVRRLLENGANSSFVTVVGDRSVPVERLLVRPQAMLGPDKPARHPAIPLPARPLCTGPAQFVRHRVRPPREPRRARPRRVPRAAHR
jgi:RHH-type transcriptional regulator, proline utilization regulon repressor / proline dehydrogenase / delta 1-pyrroline-5-carboxylate dehydrogenase